MADAHSTHICEICGSVFLRKLNKDGTQRKTKHTVCSGTCISIKASGRNSQPLKAGYRECVTCGKTFNAAANQKHCSERCRTGTKLTREQYRENCKANAKTNFVCINCGKPSYRKLSGTNKSKGSGNKFCSMECRLDAQKKDRERSIILAEHIKSEVRAIRRLGKSAYKPTKKRCYCKKCGAMYIAKLGGGLHKQICDSCISETQKRINRIHKTKRKASMRGASSEPVDPYVVFDRDKWKCRICGAHTPKKLRGTIDDRAPELDHIIPLSKGGDHTYRNTQCLCRLCNRLKSDKPLGQLLLVG